MRLIKAPLDMWKEKDKRTVLKYLRIINNFIKPMNNGNNIIIIIFNS